MIPTMFDETAEPSSSTSVKVYPRHRCWLELEIVAGECPSAGGGRDIADPRLGQQHKTSTFPRPDFTKCFYDCARSSMPLTNTATIEALTLVASECNLECSKPLHLRSPNAVPYGSRRRQMIAVSVFP